MFLNWSEPTSNEVMKVPEKDSFDALTDVIEIIYCEALGKHTENVKVNFMHTFDAESWIANRKSSTSSNNEDEVTNK